MTTITTGIFAGKTVADLQTKRDALQDAILLGRTELKLGNDVQKYASIDDMVRVVDMLNGAIDAANGDSSANRVKHFIQVGRSRFR